MCDHTAKLPPELRRMVCELLPIESLQDVRLVSQLWSHAAAAWLWHTFDSDLQTSATRKFDALLASRPGGFLDSVRSLNIRYCGFNEATDTRPLQLICMLTQGSLQAFAIDYFLDSNTLGVLIARQPNLRKLTSRIIGSRSPPGERLVAGNLKRLKELEIVASVSQAGYDTWFPHAQLLSSLTVRGTFEDRPTFLPWKSESKLKKLRKLNLDRVDFGESAGALSAWLELDCLEHLILRNCEYADSFLTTLTDTYRAHGRSALKSLEISGLDVDCEWIEDLGVFLTAISGLEYLYVSAPTDQRLEPQSICDQAASLRYLVVDYLSRWDQDNEDGSEECLYDDTSLRRLSTSCSHIEELGVGCAQIDFDDWGDLEPFKWNTAAMQSQEEKQLIKSLDAISTFPKLRVLRLTQSPIFVPNDGTDEGPFRQRQWRYQQYAEQILAYLAKKQSSVQLLAFGSTRIPTNLNSAFPDSNDHRWPHYYYLRGSSKTGLPGGHRTEQTIAVPVKLSEISKYMEESRILVDPKKV